jgi:hypothetical protein
VCCLTQPRHLANDSTSLKFAMRVDAGSSRLLSAQSHEDFHAETAFDAIVSFLREYGLPMMLTLDRDVRLSWAVRLSVIFPLRSFNSCIALASNLTSFRRIILN